MTVLCFALVLWLVLHTFFPFSVNVHAAFSVRRLHKSRFDTSWKNNTKQSKKKTPRNWHGTITEQRKTLLHLFCSYNMFSWLAHSPEKEENNCTCVPNIKQVLDTWITSIIAFSPAVRTEQEIKSDAAVLHRFFFTLLSKGIHPWAGSSPLK